VRCGVRGGVRQRGCVEANDREGRDEWPGPPSREKASTQRRNVTMLKARKVDPRPPKRSVAPAPPAIAADRLLGDVRASIEAAREQTARAVNSALVGLYWHIGTRVREDVLKNQRAGYGAEIVSALGRQLTLEFGRGFSEKTLWHMLRFAEVFPDQEKIRPRAYCQGSAQTGESVDEEPGLAPRARLNAHRAARPDQARGHIPTRRAADVPSPSEGRHGVGTGFPRRARRRAEWRVAEGGRCSRGPTRACWFTVKWDSGRLA
jgi:hypothetical protein